VVLTIILKVCPSSIDALTKLLTVLSVFHDIDNNIEHVRPAIIIDIKTIAYERMNLEIWGQVHMILNRSPQTHIQRW